LISSSPVELGGAASTSSPVSSAVRSLASLSDFSLDLNNGNFDNYSGVTDTMLSGHEATKTEMKSPEMQHHAASHHVGHHGHHRGPLLDFRCQSYKSFIVVTDTTDK
jgi:hypothetical protein